MSTQQGVIKAFMKALDTHTFKRSNFNNDTAFTTKILDAAIKACSNFSSAQAVINKMLSDCESYIAADSKKGWENFLLDKCGINLNNRDTGAITGADAGGSKIKTATSIVPESGSLKTCKKNSFTVNGLTVKLGKVIGEDTVERSYKSLSKYEQYLWNSIYSYWIKSGLDLIEQSYGSNFSFRKENSKTAQDNPTTKTLYVVFANEGKGDCAATYGGPKWAEKSTNPLKLHINFYYYSNAEGKDGNQNAENPAKAVQTNLDRTIAHELTHAVMRSNVDHYDYLPAFVKEGMGELTHGIDDDSKADLQKLASNTGLLKKSLNMSTSAIRLSDVNSPSYAAGYMFLRYLAKQASTRGKYINNSTANKSVAGTSNEDTIKNFASGVTISGKGGNDSIKNNGGNNVTISGGDGADQIYAYGKKISVNTGKDDDFVYLYSDAYNVTVTAAYGNNEIRSAAQTAKINTGGGDDYVMLYTNSSNTTVNTGAGNDSIFCGTQKSSINAGAGNDFINLYSAATSATVRAGTGNDTIENYGQKITIDGGDNNDSINNSGANVSLNAGAGDDTVYNSGSKVTIVGYSGNDSIYNKGTSLSILGGAGNDTIRNYGQKVTIDGGDNNDRIYNYATYTVTISGGNGADYISNWGAAASMLGGIGDDTIFGGEGADTILGGANNDKLYGEAGNDKLYGGAGDDTLKGDTGNDSLWGGSGNDTFIYGSGDGKDVIFGFENNDLLKITGTFSASYNSSKKEVSFKIGDGSITLKDFGSTTLFHVNNSTYQLSGNRLIKK